MKRFLPLLFLLVSLTTFGQDYSCISPTDTSYFINADGYLRGIRIDSVKVEAGDTVYYSFRTERHFTYYGSPMPDYDTSNGSWMGRKIVKQPNGVFRFQTYWLDTVFINTRAMPGDSWNFHDDTTARHYLATVMSVDTMTIKGILDSVKRIQITAYLGSAVNFSDPIHGFELLLSKSHGFASVFELYMFPYFSPFGTIYHDVFRDQVGAITPSNYIFKQVEFHVPTFLELYDFSPGDVFIQESGSWSGDFSGRTTTYDSVITKAIISPISTKYITEHKSIYTRVFGIPAHYEYYYEEGIDTFLSVDTSPAFSFPAMPEEAPESQTIWRFNPSDTSNCSAGTYYSREFIITFEGCENYFSFKKGFPQLTYKARTGTSIWPEECPSSWKKLLFSKKGGVECGHRENVVPINVKDMTGNTGNTTIYPNPATETLTIKIPKPYGEVTITDITGRALLSVACTAKETSIDISQLVPGPYIIRVNDTRQTFIKQ